LPTENCKICLLTYNNNNTELLKDVNSDTPSRHVATKWGLFGKTTLNKHRMGCQTTSASVGPIDQEFQSIEWNGDKGVFSTGSLDEALSDIGHEEILRIFGHNPERVEINGTLKERHSQYWSRDRNEMLWKHTYSFNVSKISQEDLDINPADLIREMGLRSEARKKLLTGGEKSTFVIDWADWQTGKSEGGGTPQFMIRFKSAMADAVNRIEELRKIGRNLEELVIIGGGDMIEGCTIYPNQSFHLDMHRREQIRFTVATIISGIYQLAPMFKTVRVVVAPGNHGENRIGGKRTSIGDNDDLLVFEMAEVGINGDKNMAHVSFEIAEEEESIITKIQSWNYGITHGSVYGRGAGNVRTKVFNWFKTMAANRHPVGMADVLVTHHFHHNASEDWGETLWIQTPAMDGGSKYFRELTGHTAKSGMLSWVVTPTNRLKDKQILA
jgi:phosphoribosyl-AMP cyclohydrolase